MIISVFYEHILEAQKQSGYSIPKILHILRQVGVQSVECSLDDIKENPDEIKQWLLETGMLLSSIHANFDFACQPDKITGFDLIDTAVQTGVSTVLVVPGFLPDDKPQTKEHVLNDISYCLNQLCTYAASKGITVTLEDFDGPTAPYSTIEELSWFLEQVPLLRITFDTGNFAFRGINELSAFEALKNHIVHVHCKDRSMGKNDGHPLTSVDGTLLYPSPVGSGCIHMEEILNRLNELEYTGHLSIEHFGSAQQLNYMVQSAEWLTKKLQKMLQS